MRKATKIWLLVATLLVFAGLVMMGTVIVGSNKDFSELSTRTYETNIYEISEDFGSLSINTDTADVVFVYAEDEKCRVECFEEERAKHSVTVQNDTLVIQVIDERTLMDYVGINFDKPKITVWLPKKEYASLLIRESTGDIKMPKEFHFESADVALSTGDVTFLASVSNLLKIKTSTGNLNVENISAGALELTASTGHITVSDVISQGDANIKVSTGKVNLTDFECNNLVSNGSTGDTVLNHVIATGVISVERSTGDVTFNGADAAEIKVVTDTGDVTGTLLSEKIFLVETDTGSVEVPKGVSGGTCEITTDTGNVKLEIR